MSKPDYKNILLSLIAGLGIADHMSDVADDVREVLKQIGMEDLEWDDLSDLMHKLGTMGVKTVWGTECTKEDNQE